ncbi:gliding motility lipoprotein GldB [Autumnicola edwardsiae]|uniref:Gliding motility lipoprotein GldB n=1 Tax=Autumnicola edwardsiae TaxID=3075594 RepID=A0ABU3CVQ8_9FLAO|nr:gliding motility lipoprotein GldB [Zunongwangia sp. F297]MDT0650451.1 gliding motility lipoprotein GldB [Zunongwangia sp. F297]
MVRKIFFILSIAFLSFSCETKSDVEEEIEKVQVDFEVTRFDQHFANATPDNLDTLKGEFRFFFPPQYPDSIWVNKLSDTIQQEINTEVTEEFPEFSEVEDQLHSLFQHVKYYFPNFEVPDVYTVTSEVDYKNKVIYTGSKLLIALDTYLGEDHPFYIGLQEYLKKNFRKEQIIPDAATAIAQEFIPRPDSRTFLAQMIYYGKILYLKDLWIPFKPDAEKMGYTEEELQWAKNNEEQIWRYFVENELLFQTDSELYTRFLYPAPFSKFYLLLDSESPDRLGQYLAWQMLRQYMEKNDVSVQQMLNTSAEEIFNDANYKPRK